MFSRLLPSLRVPSIKLPSLSQLLGPDALRLANRSAYLGKAHLLGLPNDVLVDRIFTHLEAHEILRLRRVCKLLYHLTHHAVIWKRLLRSTHLPIPPLPPTVRHNLRSLTAFEAERLLTRAASLERNWYWRNPAMLESWKFDAFHHIHQMVLLPGSQYMVASVSETSGSGWSVVVFVIDGRYNVIPIAKTTTETKAVNLQAKYLTVNGTPGITIAYVRRAWRHRGDAAKGIDISKYSCDHDIDPPFPVKYECHALHAPLAQLESICDPRFVPGSQEFLEHANSLPAPFRRLCFIRSTRQLCKISLDEIQGVPLLSIHRQTNSIMFKPLNGGPTTVITLSDFHEFPRSFSHVTGFRPLANQNQVMIVREVKVPRRRNKYPVTALELYDIPVNKTSETLEMEVHPMDYTFLFEDQYVDLTITEQGVPNWFEEAEDKAPPTSKYVVGKAPFKPRPINVFLRAIAPEEGLVRLTFYPIFDNAWRPPSPVSPDVSFSTSQFRLDERPPSTFRYSFNCASPIRFISAPTNTQYRVLAGTYRVLLYTVPWNSITLSPEIKDFYRYYDRELLADEPEPFVPGDARKPIHQIPLNHTFPQGTTALTWDETMGRVMYTVEGTDKVHVLDFCRMPKEDLMGRRFPLAVEQNHDLDPDSLMSMEMAEQTREFTHPHMVENTRKLLTPHMVEDTWGIVTPRMILDDE